MVTLNKRTMWNLPMTQAYNQNYRIIRYWKYLFYVLGIIPLGYITSLLSFYIYSRIKLGYLPRYNFPDPKTNENYQEFLPVITITGNIWVVSLPVWIILIVVYLIMNRKHINRRPVIISSITQVCALGFLFSGIVEWFAD